ncbi:Uncharacterised protein [Mycobacteroides abscessus]|nr:Uncharacterised protein [Mycobacteroides abscessus]
MQRRLRAAAKQGTRLQRNAAPIRPLSLED